MAMAMPPESAKYVWDAAKAAERIARFTDGKTFADYAQDEMLRSAVERQFEVIGESLGQWRKASPEHVACLPDLARIVAFRNVHIHGYASVDDQLVWGMVVTQLPGLLRELRALLATAAPGST
jgi:uncharacterized protein with HEPN domain